MTAAPEGGLALALAAAGARGDGGALGPLGRAGAALPDRRRRRARDRAHAYDRRASSPARGGPDQGLFLRQRRRRRPGSPGSIPAGYCSLLQNRFDELRLQEVVPAIRVDCRSPEVEIVAAGASIGAFNAVARLCRHPDVFSAGRSASAAPTIWRSCSGFRADENLLLLLAAPVPSQPRRGRAARACCGTASSSSPSARAAGRTPANPGAWPTCSAARASPTALTRGATNGTMTGRPGAGCCRIISKHSAVSGRPREGGRSTP